MAKRKTNEYVHLEQKIVFYETQYQEYKNNKRIRFIQSTNPSHIIHNFQMEINESA